MSNSDQPQGGAPSEAPEPIVEKGRGISLIWVIPVVALVVGGVIAFDAIRNRGIEIVISFPDAAWVEAGKTKVRYLEYNIGTVDTIELRKTLDGVDLHCTMKAGAKQYLSEGAKFWLVHPRVGAGGISGLGTILSGAYIAMSLGPADGKAQREFKGLIDPPLLSQKAPGLTIELHAENLNSLGPGSPIYYREVKVGTVEQHTLKKDGSGVVLRLFFPSEHADLVREDSRFWDSGGIHVSGTLAEFQVQSEPLEALLAGGIAFDSPRGAKARPATKDSRFWLHRSQKNAEIFPFRYGGLRIYVEGPQLGSIHMGDYVYYREIPVGAVITQELLSDSRHVRIGLNIQKRYATLVRSNSVFWNASGISASLGLSGLEIHTGSIASILAGGIAFATPNSPGHPVEPKSVFQMHDEVKDEWLEWSPLIWRGPPGEAPPEAAKQARPESKIARFFHHKGKSEEESEKTSEPEKDAGQEAADEETRHRFFHDLFHRDKDEEKEGEEEAKKEAKNEAKNEAKKD